MKLTTKIPGMSLYPGTGQHWWASITSEEIVEAARRCEQLGFEYITISDHIVMNQASTSEMGPRWVHSLAAAGFILGATNTIKVVPLVVVPYRNPVELAKVLSTLDFISGGRLIPLLMVGYQRWEFDLMRSPYNARGQVMDEYVEAMQLLWTSERPAFHGEHIDFDDVVFDPKPVQEPLPLWFGGRTRSALKRIARFGDAWVSYATPRAQFREMVDFIRQQPEFMDRPRPLATWLELFEGRRDPTTHAVIEQARIVRDKDVILEQMNEIAEVGATMTSLDDIVGLGKFQNDRRGAPTPARGMSDYLERLEWLAEEILPHASGIGANGGLTA